MDVVGTRKGDGMDLFTILVLNLAFGLGIFLILSSRLNRIAQESYGYRLQEKIQKIYSLFIQESNLQLELLDNKIRGLRDLLIRTDKALEELKEENATLSGLRLQLQNLINQSKELLAKTEGTTKQIIVPNQVEPIPTLSVEPTPEQNKKAVASSNPSPPWIEGIGKTVKELFLGKSNIPEVPTSFNNKPQGRLLYSVEGDPFQEEGEKIVDLNQEFLVAMRNPSLPNQDKVSISPEAILAQLPPSSTKIDKTVHLLKNGFSHEEIAKILNLGTREISLIETIRMKNL